MNRTKKTICICSIAFIMIISAVVLQYCCSQSYNPIRPEYVEKRPMIEHTYIYSYDDIIDLIGNDVVDRIGINPFIDIEFKMVDTDEFEILDYDIEVGEFGVTNVKFVQEPQITITYKTECCAKEK